MSKIKLTLTAEHYQAAKEIEYLYYLEHVDKQDFASYCDDRIKELSIPTQVKYTEADMLEFDVPSPWRTDIENAPKDGMDILIKPFNDQVWSSFWDGYLWYNEYKDFNNSEIAYWMEIPELPTI